MYEPSAFCPIGCGFGEGFAIVYIVEKSAYSEFCHPVVCVVAGAEYVVLMSGFL